MLALHRLLRKHLSFQQLNDYFRSSKVDCLIPVSACMQLRDPFQFFIVIILRMWSVSTYLKCSESKKHEVMVHHAVWWSPFKWILLPHMCIVHFVHWLLFVVFCLGDCSKTGFLVEYKGCLDWTNPCGLFPMWVIPHAGYSPCGLFPSQKLNVWQVCLCPFSTHFENWIFCYTLRG